MSTDPIQWVPAVAVVATVAVGGAGTTTSGGGLAPEDVSPGVIGFLVTLALVLACIPLFRSMTGKLRGVQHRAGAVQSAGDAAPEAHPAGSVDDDDLPPADASAADEESLGRDTTGPRPDAG